MKIKKSLGITLAVFTTIATGYAALQKAGASPAAEGALGLPYSIEPTEEELDQLIIIDNNQDEDDHGTYVCGVWSYDANVRALMYLYSLTDDADDYVVLPLLAFDDPDKAYEISLDVMAAGRNYPENFEICISDRLIPRTMKAIYTSGDITNDEDWETVTVPFGVEKAGSYYLAVHCTSKKENTFKLFVKNICVKEASHSVSVPLAPEAITATPAEKGRLSATVAFTMPSMSIANKALDGDVTVTVKSAVDEKKVTAPAGQPASVEVATVQGTNNITLTAENAGGVGNSAFVSVYTGVDKPKAPALEAKVSEDNMSLVISWEQSETGVNGGYVDPATVNYTIYHYDEKSQDYDDGTVLTGVTSYTYTCEPGTPQHRESFFITAKNVAGQEEAAAHTVDGTIGTPYGLPMVETLPKGKLTYSPLTKGMPDASYSTYADFRVYDLNTIFETPDPNYENILDGHSSAIWAFNRYEAGKCRFQFPKFSTEGVGETKFKLNAFINSIFPTVDVYVSSYGIEPVKVGSFGASDGNGWSDFVFLIPDTFAGCKWVQVSLDAVITDYENQNIFISGYTFAEQKANDMALEALVGPEDALSVGETGEFTATVRNEGKNAAAAPSVKFSLVDSQGREVKSATVTSGETLAPEGTAAYTFNVEATADLLGDYTLVASLVEGDDNADNDSLDLSVSVIKGNRPVVNDLKAVGYEETSKVVLTWSKPDLDLSGKEGFENNEPFEYGKYIGNFKNVDMDGKKTYSYDQCVFDAATLPKAFMVINPDYLNNKLVLENYTPHSGNQYIVAFCPADGSKANDWLISPEVKPGSVVSFYVSTVVISDYSEDFEICYSSTGNNPADFKVLERKSAYGVNWTGVAVVLPEDARYFAIHYTTMDVFGLMIDDIQYTPLINEGSVFRYNVYEDGVLVASNLEETSFELHDVASLDRTYNVTAVVDGVEYAPSNSAVPSLEAGVGAVSGRSILVAGNVVTVRGYEGKAVMAVALDGRQVYVNRDAAEEVSFRLDRGVYVIEAGKDVRKVIVR